MIHKTLYRVDRKLYRAATVHETMGPNYKDIYWFQNKPLVLKNSRIKSKNMVIETKLIKPE